MSAGSVIACWRVKGDPAKRLATGEWTDGAPSADTLAEYARLGWQLECAYQGTAASTSMIDREPKVTLGYENRPVSARFYKSPEQEGWKRIRLERANDALHDLELRVNVQQGRALVDLNDGILRAVSVSCPPTTLRV
jgi:hypothetical protein